ncbi:MAG: efflux RND transporter periplasmic adaptor subunit [Coleofasciculus sp. C1-SOL-03]|uniref:efflux RND transporter periplasmic adaptor subunit n=1 Tax=Coleofasciculus sp. C1-SOL-03 TaxID=3069522 RepID=UPI0032FE5DC3
MLYVYQIKKNLKLANPKVLGFIALLLLSSLTIGLSRRLRQEEAANPPASVHILPVETRSATPVNSYPVSRTYTGEIVARRRSELGFERSGQLVFVAVDEGDRVNPGTPLARLDTSRLEAERRQLLAQRSQAVAQLQELQAGPRTETIEAARATVRQINEQLELAQTKRSRREWLYAQGAISREQLDEVAFEASTLTARRDEAKSNLEELLAGTRREQIAAQSASVKQLDARITSIEIDLANSTIKAPFAGTISRRLVDEGTVVSMGQSILHLVEDAGLEARIGVPVTATAQLQVGSQHQLQIGQNTYSATVSSVQPELDSSTRTVSVVLTLEPSAAATVTPGELARWERVESIPTSGYWLPTTALVQGTRGLWSCYVMAKAPKPQENQESPRPASVSSPQSPFHVERRDVEILHTESDRVLVRGTLQPSDQVIVNGVHRLVPGQFVRPAQR